MQRLLPPSVYLLICVLRFTGPRFIPRFPVVEMFVYRDPDGRCSLVEIQMYLPTPRADFVGVQDDLVDIQVDSGDQLKKGAVLLCHLFSPPRGSIVLVSCFVNVIYHFD